MRPAAIRPICCKATNLREKPTKGAGRNRMDVPAKKEMKKRRLPIRLTCSAAPVKARRNGGQKANPVTSPATVGRDSFSKARKRWYDFVHPASQEVFVLKKP
jgi:hypothetical protein